MENFGDYLRAGVTMGLGTDTAPHNLVEEMRKAAMLARIAARDIETVTTADFLSCGDRRRRYGTAARRYRALACGNKADLVLVDLDSARR